MWWYAIMSQCIWLLWWSIYAICDSHHSMSETLPHLLTLLINICRRSWSWFAIKRVSICVLSPILTESRYISTNTFGSWMFLSGTGWVVRLASCLSIESTCGSFKDTWFVLFSMNSNQIRFLSWYRCLCLRFHAIEFIMTVFIYCFWCIWDW